MKNPRLYLESLIATILVFAVLGLLAIFPYNIKVFNPIKALLKDFKYTDLYYSQIATKKKSQETDIVLVNVGTLDRAGMTVLINRLQAASPKVIGVDILFVAQKDPAIDSALKVALSAENVVMASNLTNINANPGLRTSNEYFGDLTYGFTNFVSEDSLNTTIRYFRPFFDKGDVKRKAFTSTILEMYDEEAYARLEARGKDVEVISYRGKYDRFIYYEGLDVISGNFNTEAVKNKIVMIGFLGNTIGTVTGIEDRFFTPMNKELVGRSLPDMFGMTIHANILSMMMDGKYINKMPYFLALVIAFIVCFIHVVFFTYFFVQHHLWYHLFAKLAQFVTSILLLYIMFLFYTQAQYKINSTLIILAILVSVDVLYLYESLAAYVYKRFHIKSYFIHEH